VFGIIGGLTPWGCFGVLLAVLAVLFTVSVIVHTYRRRLMSGGAVAAGNLANDRAPAPHSKARSPNGRRSLATVERDALATELASTVTEMERNLARKRGRRQEATTLAVSIGFLVIGGARPRCFPVDHPHSSRHVDPGTDRRRVPMADAPVAPARRASLRASDTVAAS
jgi:hypothetical protein